MKISVTYRQIAKMLVSSLPVEGPEFGLKVEEYLSIIKGMKQESKVALKSAYIFSRKVPKPEREDMFQELFSAIYEVHTKDEPFGYTIARCDWRNWWQKYMTRQHYFAGSLKDTVTDGNGKSVELSELIVGEVEFEAKMVGKFEAQRIRSILPGGIRHLVDKRLLGKALTKLERECLNRWSSKNISLLLT